MEAIIITKKEFESFLKKLEEIKDIISKSKNTSFENKWLNNLQVCDFLRISKRTLQNYRDNGILPFSQIGSKIYYKTSDIELHLESNYISLKGNSFKI